MVKGFPDGVVDCNTGADPCGVSAVSDGGEKIGSRVCSSSVYVSESSSASQMIRSDCPMCRWWIVNGGGVVMVEAGVGDGLFFRDSTLASCGDGDGSVGRVLNEGVESI